MPIFKADSKLILYAHVPKCGGSAVSWYLSQRFGALAFQDSKFTNVAPNARWSKTSPQHIDRASLARLFPDGFFDATFSIVRHPVARLVSAYHFQKEVEQSVPGQTGFSEWLQDLADLQAGNPFVYDNHIRAMDDIVPEGATIFYMEHGLDALVPWFDDLTGQNSTPRALPRINERGTYKKVATERAEPSDWDLERIGELYARDFERFGYSVDSKMPKAAAPELSAEIIAERDTALRDFNSPVSKLSQKVSRWIRP